MRNFNCDMYWPLLRMFWKVLDLGWGSFDIRGGFVLGERG